jgi:hypothetical protein
MLGTSTSSVTALLLLSLLKKLDKFRDRIEIEATKKRALRQAQGPLNSIGKEIN